jgi:hypothetical protein
VPPEVPLVASEHNQMTWPGGDHTAQARMAALGSQRAQSVEHRRRQGRDRTTAAAERQICSAVVLIDIEPSSAQIEGGYARGLLTATRLRFAIDWRGGPDCESAGSRIASREPPAGSRGTEVPRSGQKKTSSSRLPAGNDW